ncbi:hypothetical protein [Nocardia sp. R7R-8]|uniref:hypothetical protein n=1 Tax=Nocardia sp. R7R-8 TaxID=3459304 RepID=UPI00403DE713
MRGTGHATAAQVDAAGGIGVAYVFDHSDDDAVGRLFELIRTEHGRPDVLVNDVYNPRRGPAAGPAVLGDPADGMGGVVRRGRPVSLHGKLFRRDLAEYYGFTDIYCRIHRVE